MSRAASAQKSSRCSMDLRCMSAKACREIGLCAGIFGPGLLQRLPRRRASGLERITRGEGKLSTIGEHLEMRPSAFGAGRL
mmetsp:Transcript_18577/g.50390  ORF Transcript_18577/g.50390 Transcript_18577/m.50390 type:complete len:81 (+) Transcript_18577:2053-2295(+)